jgi:hypothetical protein
LLLHDVANVSYKRQAVPRAWKPEPPSPRAAPPCLDNRHCRAPPPTCSRSQVTPVALSLVPSGAQAAALWPDWALTSPEQELQRPPPPGAAEPPRWPLFRPNRATKSSPGGAGVTSPPLPDHEHRRARRNLASHTARLPVDQIARGVFFRGAFVQKRTHL